MARDAANILCWRINAATHGKEKTSCLIGSAAWNQVAITQWILGVRATFDGPRVAPIIPSDWPGFTARRIFHGVT